jgi:predicted nucleic acid-binding protein
VKPRYLLDSVILIDHLRGVEAATDWLRRLRDGEAVLSAITRAEVLSGGTEAEAAVALALCDEFDCLPLTASDATSAAALRRRHGWKLPDAFQAAVAIRSELKLVIRDLRGFGGRKHSFVVIPYSL